MDQPEDSQIFASFRADTQASSSLFAPTTPRSQGTQSTTARPGKFGVSPSTSATPTQIAGRTASQSICVS